MGGIGLGSVWTTFAGRFPLNACLAHQASNPIMPGTDPLFPQFSMDAWCAVNTPILFPDGADGLLELAVRLLMWTGCAVQPGIIPTFGDVQHRTQTGYRKLRFTS